MKHTSHEFLEIFTQSLSDNNFIKLSLSNFHGIEPDLKKIDIRKILIKKEEKLSFTYHYKTRDIVKNHSNEEGIQLIEKLLTNDFRGANLYTTEFDLRYDAISRTPKLHKSKPTQKAATLSHDREKDRLISNSKSYLHDLNITDEKGNVFKNAQDKYKQINKYVEILSGLIKNLPPEKLAKIVDMGSGKGYLTFALYDYMTNTMGLRPEVTGVEYRQDMVDLCNKIAKNSGFNSLHFEQGTIDKYDSIGTNILIALHACDTATDDAIAKGIKADADLIVVAPCCHKQIRNQIEAGKAHNELDFLTKHGIFLERQAEMVTDGLRSLILEYFGYSTKIFEFISGEHTAKNVMIVGTKTSSETNPKILEKIKRTKEYFGIGYHQLERILEI